MEFVLVSLVSTRRAAGVQRPTLGITCRIFFHVTARHAGPLPTNKMAAIIRHSSLGLRIILLSSYFDEESLRK